MTVSAPVKRGTALRLGLEPPRGPLLGVITIPGRIFTPEEYQEIENRFAKALKGRWQFVYTADVAEDRARRRALPWWPFSGRQR
jgi:hypothetical protein